MKNKGFMENINANESLIMENNENEYIRRFRQELLERHVIEKGTEDDIALISKGHQILVAVMYPIPQRTHEELDKIAFSIGLKKVREGSIRRKISGFYTSVHVYEPVEQVEVELEGDDLPVMERENPIPLRKRRIPIYCPTVTPPRRANCYAM